MSDIYSEYETVVGLEVHMQLNTHSKAYASDKNEFGALPNTLVSPITLGHPGTLPKVNKESIRFAIQLAHATGMTIHQEVYFARKNYFYADLPKGYQITQDKTPICTGGSITIQMEDGTEKVIGITRAHLEEDAGKSMHDQDPFDTLVDLNRAGVPLIEVVSEPDMRSSKEAGLYLTEIRKLVRYLQICDGNMEEGSLRCDANISVRKKGSAVFGTRCEVKNMNSIRNVQRAIEAEVKRQIDILEAGGKIDQETRSFDPVNGTTSTLRSKEDAQDYRYFPEPDLPPVVISNEQIEEIKAEMPALPRALYETYTKSYGLSEYDAMALTAEREIALTYEEILKHTKNYKAACNWLMGPVKAYLNENALEVTESPFSPEQIVGLIQLVDSGKISQSTAAEKILPELAKSKSAKAENIAQEQNLIQDADEDTILALAKEILASWPDKVEAYKNGNKGMLGLFMGELMKKSGGKANPKSASALIQKLLES